MTAPLTPNTLIARVRIVLAALAALSRASHRLPAAGYTVKVKRVKYHPDGRVTLTLAFKP